MVPNGFRLTAWHGAKWFLTLPNGFCLTTWHSAKRLCLTAWHGDDRPFQLRRTPQHHEMQWRADFRIIRWNKYFVCTAGPFQALKFNDGQENNQSKMVEMLGLGTTDRILQSFIKLLWTLQVIIITLLLLHACDCAWNWLSKFCTHSP